MAHFTLPVNMPVSGYLDGNPVTIVIDISEPVSRVRWHMLNVHRATSIHCIKIPHFSDMFVSRNLCFLHSNDLNVDVFLGRDWYEGCIKSADTSENSQRQSHTLSYLEILLRKHSGKSYLFHDQFDITFELHQHGLQTLPSNSSSDQRRMLLLNHIFTGSCLSSLGELCLQVQRDATASGTTVITAYLYSYLRTSQESDLTFTAVKEICDAVGLNAPLTGRASLLLLLVEFGDFMSEESMHPFQLSYATIEGSCLMDLKRAAFTHGLEFWVGSSNRLKDDIYTHLGRGECCVPPLDNFSPSSLRPRSGCDHLATLARSQNTCIYQKSNLNCGNGVCSAMIMNLSRCLRESKITGLRRMLSILGIVCADRENKVKDLQDLMKRYIIALQRDHFSILAPQMAARTRHERHRPNPGNDTPLPVSSTYPRSHIVPPCTMTNPPAETQSHVLLNHPWPHIVPPCMINPRANAPSPALPTYIWPHIVPSYVKWKIVCLFRHATSSKILHESTCAVCGTQTRTIGGIHQMSLDKIDEDLIKIKDPSLLEKCHVLTDWSKFSMADRVRSLALDPQGVVCDGNDVILQACTHCRNAIVKRRTPHLALANGLLVGSVPPELQDLTLVEEMLIARARAKGCIIQLKQGGSNSTNDQKGMRGNIIIFPQRPEKLADILPPTLCDIQSMVCIIFVGSFQPSLEWIKSKAKPLLVRRERIRKALAWLKQNNPLYSEVNISDMNIAALPDNACFPVYIRFHNNSRSFETVLSSYDSCRLNEEGMQSNQNGHDFDITFDKVIVSDVDGNSSTSQLKAAALRHLSQQGSAYIEVPHDPLPINEFFNPELFPMIYPTLYPFGIGGFEDKSRHHAVGLKRHVRHLLSLNDCRFKEHQSFIFTVFNILQRRQFLLNIKMRVKSHSFKSIALEIATLNSQAVKSVTERVAKGDTLGEVSDDERRVLKLMKEVKLVMSTVPGSSSSRVAMRNQIRVLTMSEGVPSFFVTINPSDVYSPVVRLLAGDGIDIDELLPEQAPEFLAQSALVARNPIVAAKFFNIFMKAFIKEVLGWKSLDGDLKTNGGVLGKVKAYYGCVEAQGRGSLHCHMLIWIAGALNPNQIRDRIIEAPNSNFVQHLLQMLNDTISNDIPNLPSVSPDTMDEVMSTKFHACSVRGVDPRDPRYPDLRTIDMHYLTKRCQVHIHTHTCYKYWKGPPEPRNCRFDLEESNIVPDSTVDPDNGEIRLRHLSGLVNNFNETILEALRCNMDIKFVGSGQSAKAIIYYVTDYITKTQLKAHVAYGALELAIQRLGEYCHDDDCAVRAKRLLQKCAYATISEQELSAQQVSSYLLDYEDHFTSHQYRNLWWTSFEHAIDVLDVRYKVRTSDEWSVTGIDETIDTSDDQVDRTCEIERDVTICRDNMGQIVARSGQTADYIWRGPALRHVCLWDFVSCIEKVKRTSHKNNTKLFDGETDDDDDELSQKNYNDRFIESSEDISHFSDETSFDDITKSKRFCFSSCHIDHRTHILQVYPASSRKIPVPIGPAIPRRDRPYMREKYCRLMLILFKPWVLPTDLKAPDETWDTAFQRFASSCAPKYLDVMENMQMLHECKDSRDDHFASRRTRCRSRSDVIQSAWTEDIDVVNDDTLDGNVEDQVLEHLLDIDRSLSLKRAWMTKDAALCVAAAEQAGLLATINLTTANSLNLCDMTEEDKSGHKLITDDTSDDLESTWRHWYTQQRQKVKQARLSDTAEGLSASSYSQHAFEKRVALSRVLTGNEPRVAVNDLSITPENPSNSSRYDSSPESVASHCARKYMLNDDQVRAFRIIAQACHHTWNNDSLMMYVGGCGGTGKSRVIETVSYFFESIGQARRFRLASYTGVAARNISGTTLHSVLGLHQRSKKALGSQAKQDLMRMWDQVDFLLIDEVSMIGCDTLLCIHEALTEIKSSSRPFGGINIIFFGDFFQLPPVGDTKLLAKIATQMPAQSGTVRGQRQVLGKLLWLQVTSVVLLSRPMRQGGPENWAFFELLNRLRVGKCTLADFHLLETRLASNVIRSESDRCEWRNVPIIVSTNSAKDNLNERAVEAFAQERGLKIDWYYAEDRHRGHLIKDEALIDEIATFHSGQTGQRLTRLPLVVGMPIVLSSNYDVENGAVNGTMGVVKQIRYYVNDTGKKVAKACIIKCGEYSGDVLPHLQQRELAVLPDNVKVTFMHPHSGKKITISRNQLPLAAAFAITAHKAQGLTLTKAVVDLANCRGSEAPYVMLSRVRSLNDVLILREFDRKRISCPISDHMKMELARMELLDKETRNRFRRGVVERPKPCVSDMPWNGSNVSDREIDALRQYYDLLENDWTSNLSGDGDMTASLGFGKKRSNDHDFNQLEQRAPKRPCPELRNTNIQ